MVSIVRGFGGTLISIKNAAPAVAEGNSEFDRDQHS
jgi:hypothetical protein